MRSLKFILELPAHANNMATYEQAGLLPLDLYRKQLCASYAIRIHTINNNAQKAYQMELQEPVIITKQCHTTLTLPAYIRDALLVTAVNP